MSQVLLLLVLSQETATTETQLRSKLYVEQILYKSIIIIENESMISILFQGIMIFCPEL